MPNLGLPEILVIVAVVILIFGIGKVADVGGALGRSIREFRRELREGEKEDEAAKPTPRSEAKVESRREEGKAPPPPPSGSAMSH